MQIEGLAAWQPGTENPDAAELEEKLADLEATLKGHFECEEGAVLAVFRELDRPELVLTLEAVIGEKELIFKELAGLKREAGHLIAFNLGLEPNYDSSGVRRKMEELARRIESHKEKEESLFEEAERS
jgi:predicted ATP-grasp superfamily ATP-dependent carboligase